MISLAASQASPPDTRTHRDHRGQDREKDRPTVLLVDDDAHLRQILSTLLQHHGYHTLEAANGRDAFLVAQEGRPDLVVMDLRMPGMSGIEATRLLREFPQMEHTPVLMLTVQPNVEAWEQASAAGCEAYLLKPCRHEDLLREIRRLLARGR
jgi:CheY-like chemotaxis protein